GLVFVAFDFETTGLDPAVDTITEIGAVRFNLSGTEEEYSTLVDPGIPIPDHITKITGISDAMVTGQMKLRDAFSDFMSFAANSVLVAHHAPFDAGFLSEKFRAFGLEQPSNLILDTRIMAKRLLGKLPGYRLDRICSALGITVPVFHRALPDACACRDIFCAMVKSLPDFQSIMLSQLSEKAINLFEQDINQPV
ncbi:MAG: 3'-5' exonuclease, partial [Spirochaetaceae bacterium]